MQRIKWKMSAGAALAYALAYFFDGSGIVSAAVPAIFVHELGHLVALRLCAIQISAICVKLCGLQIDYIGELYGFAAVFCIASGPLFGLLYCLIAFAAGGKFLTISGNISLVLSMFNLLPVLPLDGGRLLAALTVKSAAERFSQIFAVFLFTLGIFLFLRSEFVSLMIMSLWLLHYNFKR